MFSIVLSIHILLCIVLIGIVLIQQGKGADAGAIMGGGTDSVLGAGAAGSALTKVTTTLAIGFMVTSILLVKAYNSGMYISTTTGERDVLQGSVMEPVAKEQVADEVTAPALDPDATTAEGAEAAANTEAAPAAVDQAEESVVEENTSETATAAPAAAEGASEEQPVEEAKPAEAQ